MVAEWDLTPTLSGFWFVLGSCRRAKAGPTFPSGLVDQNGPLVLAGADCGSWEYDFTNR